MGSALDSYEFRARVKSRLDPMSMERSGICVRVDGLVMPVAPKGPDGGGYRIPATEPSPSLLCAR